MTISYNNELIQRIVDLDEESVLTTVKERLQKKDDPFILLEECQEGMRQVGICYEHQEYYLSGLIMAGEIFREAMELIEPALKKHLYGRESGHILLGTVQGDIHDIGKNIFSTMMSCHGFTVTDLGVDVKPELFLESTRKIKPDILGLSGLLTISYDAMRQTIRLIRQSNDTNVAQIPAIIGGGILNSKICAYAGADYWSIDAMIGVNICKEIMAKKFKNKS